jgi:hypothetical protein
LCGNTVKKLEIFWLKVWQVIKNVVHLHRYPENNLFTLKGLIPIEDMKRLPVRVIALFFVARKIVKYY